MNQKNNQKESVEKREAMNHSISTRDAVETAIDLSRDRSGTWEASTAKGAKRIPHWGGPQQHKEQDDQQAP